MSEPAAIEGRVVHTPGGGVQRQYSYYYRTNQGQSQSSPGGGGGTGGGGRTRVTRDLGSWLSRDRPVRVEVPQGVPRFLGNRSGIMFAWIGAMTLVSLDEWKRNNLLPRPSRLWSATWVFAILALMSIWDPLVPIVNLLALGYLITLAYQYFNQQGQFA